MMTSWGLFFDIQFREIDLVEAANCPSFLGAVCIFARGKRLAEPEHPQGLGDGRRSAIVLKQVAWWYLLEEHIIKKFKLYKFEFKLKIKRYNIISLDHFKN